VAKTVSVGGYLPEVIAAIREFKAIATAEDPELTDLWAEIENAFNDQYVVDATVNGVKRYESILKIVPKATETLEDRKFRILAKYNEQLPYTYRALVERLNTLCGEAGYSLEVDIPGYTVTVRVELIVKNQFDAVDDLLENIVPMNMVIDLSLRYNQNSTLSAFTNGQLSIYTHGQLRNEVIT
jgi:hypothetical protein